MFPSVKTIRYRLNVSLQTAKTIRGLIDGSTSPFCDDFPRTKLLEANFRRYGMGSLADSNPYAVLQAINETLNFYGVEEINSDQYDLNGYWGSIACLYVNNGEAYNNTVVYDVSRNVYYVMSWGDWTETYENSNRGRLT